MSQHRASAPSPGGRALSPPKPLLLLVVLALLAAACNNRALDEQNRTAAGPASEQQQLGDAGDDDRLAGGASSAGSGSGAGGAQETPGPGTASPGEGVGAVPDGGQEAVERAAGAAPPGQSAGQPAGAGGTVKIGGVFHRTGPAAELTESCFRGARSVINDINARGGASGYKFEFIAYDDNTDANRTAALTQRLISDDKVELIFGQCADLGADAARDVTVRANMPVLGPPIINHPNWYSTPNWYPVTGDQQPLWVKVAIDHLASKGIKEAAVTYPNVFSGQGSAKFSRKYFAEHGVKNVYDQAYGLEPDWNPYVSRMKSAGVEGVICICTADIVVNYFNAAKQQNFRAQIWAPFPTYNPSMLARVGPFLDGLLHTVVSHLTVEEARSPEGAKRFVDRVKKDWPNQAISSPVMQGWIAGEVLVEATRRLGGKPFTKENITAALQTFDNWEGGTFNAPLTFTATQGHPYAAMCEMLLEASHTGYRVVPPKLHCVKSF